MKSIGVIALFTVLLGTNGCEKVKDIIPVPSMKATVDGEAWTSLFRVSVYNESQTPSSIIITGTPGTTEISDETIILTVFGLEEGTYNLSTTLTTGAALECAVVYKKVAGADETDDNYYAAYEATVVITKLDKEKKMISGSFTAKCINTATIVDEVIINSGTFENLNYTIK